MLYFCVLIGTSVLSFVPSCTCVWNDNKNPWILEWSEDPLHGKENPFHTTSRQERNTLQEVQSREYFTRTNTQGSPQGANKARLDFARKKNLKKPDHFWKSLFGRLKLRSTFTRMAGRKKYGEGLEQLMIQRIQHHLWNMVEQCDGMSMHGFQWHWVIGVLYINGVTEDRSSWGNSEVNRDILST